MVDSDMQQTLFAKAQASAEQMIPTAKVGYISINGLSDNKLYFEYEDCEQLDKARTSHSMVFHDPYIYVVGGIVDNFPNRKCKKFHVYDKVWCDIAPIGFSGNLTSPAIIAVEDNLYVFDTYSASQSIHKYSIGYDIWENIPFKTTDFKIPRSLNSNIYRYV